MALGLEEWASVRSTPAGGRPVGRSGPRHRRRSRRYRYRRLVLRVVILAASVALVTTVVVVLVSPPPPPPLGAYAGYENTAGVAEVGTASGIEVHQAMDFFDPTTWDKAVESPSQMVPVWNRTGYRMTWGVTMLPTAGGSLAEGATGAYDHYFATVARTLVADGQGSSIIRLGWEFNGYWFPWSAATCPQCFVTYWRDIVTTMRSVPGAQFEFEWNPTAGSYGLDPTEAYPGDAYVDLIGLDVYDNVPGSPTPAQRWQTLLNEPFGLTWVLGFADTHGKSIAIPEWGLGYGAASGGDDPYFIDHMAGFITSHPQIVSALYWNYGSSQLSGAPKARAAFATAFHR